MSNRLHHIRLLAGLETRSLPGRRTLDRQQADQLAEHLAADLARAVPQVNSGLLVVAGVLFEPNEVIQPELPVWQALEDLAGRLTSRDDLDPGILAIGAHQQRFPDERLDPPAHSPAGQFLVLPLLLICPDEQATALERALESELFERASIDPPARALLADAIGLDTVHGQLLTLNDLIALQHVQFDSAGLGGFWPLVEHALLESGTTSRMSLPGNLTAKWNADDRRVIIEFSSLDQFQGECEDYMLWLRAFRSLIALLEAHGIDWAANPSAPVVLDDRGGIMIETAGSTSQPDSLTVHHHPDLGLVAWTLVEDGRMMNLYPLSPDAAGTIERDLTARELDSVHHCDMPNINQQTGRLQPPTTP